jgi:hypothetical protein
LQSGLFLSKKLQCGRYDYTVNRDLSYNYYLRVKAPHKMFYTFEQSAKSSLFEEPDRFKDVLVRDILHNDRAENQPL